MRVLTLMPFVAVILFSTPAIADGAACAKRFLSGEAQATIDAATGQPIVTLPYAIPGAGGYAPVYDVVLGGGVYKPAPVDPVPVDPDPVDPGLGFTDTLRLAPNATGATMLTFPGDGTGRLIGPDTDFVFTGVDPTGLFVDGDLIATGGSGTINGVFTTAIVQNGRALSVGSGFNVTRTRGVNARFANGTILDTVVAIGTPPPPPPAGGFAADLALAPNALGATQLVFLGDGTARLSGGGVDVTFTGVDASALAFDGPLIARAGSGTINGQAVTALPGFNGAVLSLGSGFNPTGTQDLRVNFDSGAILDTTILRS